MTAHPAGGTLAAQVTITICLLVAAAQGPLVLSQMWLLGGVLAWALVDINKPDRLWRYVLMWPLGVWAEWAVDFIRQRGVWE